MHKLHITVIAALVALAAIAGMFATVRTTGLGSAARRANDATVAAKTRQLAAYERSLAQALAAKTPALPKLPAGSPAPASSTQQRVIYHRPPPVVVVKHTHNGDDGFESAAGGGSDD